MRQKVAMLARCLALVILAVIPVLCPPRALAQPVPVGPEFQVNSYTTGSQYVPRVGFDAAGNFVVAWHGLGSAGSDTDARSVHGRRYDASGIPLGDEFQANTYTSGDQVVDGLAVRSDGGFVIVWRSDGSTESDTDGQSVQARLYDASGAPLGGQFQVNSYTTGYQSFASVAADSLGRFVVVWRSSGSDGSDTDGPSIRGQRFDANAVALGSEFQVNAYTTGAQFFTQVAATGAGNFVVAWDSYGGFGSDTSYRSIQAQLFDADGMPVGAQFQVNTYTTGNQVGPSVAMEAGVFVVAWSSVLSAGSDHSGYSVHARRYDADGTPLGDEFQVNSYTTANQRPGGVSVDASGNTIVTWQSGGSAASDSDSISIQFQRYDPAGNAVGGEVQVNSYTTGSQAFGDVDTDATGNFVVAWQSQGGFGSDISARSIQAQRYVVSPSLPTDALPGRSAVIKKGQVAKFTSRSADVVFSLPSVDPVSTGGVLRIFDTSSVAGDDIYFLPAGGEPPLGWKGLGNPAGAKGYKYKGAGTIGDPCKVVLVKEKVIKGVCKGTGVTLTPPFVGDVGIVLSLGTTDRYCARFGGDETRNDATLTKRRNAPAPGACP